MSRLSRNGFWMIALIVGLTGIPSSSVANSIKASSLIFNTFGPGYSYVDNGGWGESGSSTAFPDIVAMAFTPSATAPLGSIDVAIGWGGTSQSFILALMTNNGGVPGTTLESWNVTSSYIFGTCGTCFETVFDKLHIKLQGGVEYWLVPFPSSGFDGGWNDNNLRRH